MSSGHSLSTDRSGTETGAMPSLGGTALAVGCLSESMEGALRERSNIFQACAGKCCSSKRSLHWEHVILGRVARDITIKYNFLCGSLNISGRRVKEKRVCTMMSISVGLQQI